jgi:hypothetical protein
MDPAQNKIVYSYSISVIIANCTVLAMELDRKALLQKVINMLGQDTAPFTENTTYVTEIPSYVLRYHILYAETPDPTPEKVKLWRNSLTAWGLIQRKNKKHNTPQEKKEARKMNARIGMRKLRRERLLSRTLQINC